MALLQPIAENMSFDDYLLLERTSDEKHEYIAGLVYAMAGASLHHNLIAGNLFAALHSQVRGTPCSAFMADMLLRLRINDEDIAYYPDLMISCTPNNPQNHFIETPKVIIEILSNSTKRIDLREKFLSYQTIASLQEYIVVKQTEMSIIQYGRASDWQATYIAQEENLLIPSIEFTMAVEDIYERVQFAD